MIFNETGSVNYHGQEVKFIRLLKKRQVELRKFLEKNL